MKIHSVIRPTPRPARELVPFLVGLLVSAQDRAFDRLLDVQTRQIIITENSVFGAGGDNCPYSGSQWLPVRRALKELGPGPADVFVDFGSGKGKVLLIAARLPYRRVVGVELDEELSQCSRSNIKRARHRLRAREVTSITANVLEWPIPGDTSAVFMYNPFIGETFRSVVYKIFASYDHRPRSLHIVYRYPWEHNWLLSTGRVVVDGVRSSNWPAPPRWWQTGDVIITYRVVGRSGENTFAAPSRRPVWAHRAIQRWSGPNDHQFTMSAPGQETLYSRSHTQHER